MNALPIVLGILILVLIAGGIVLFLGARARGALKAEFPPPGRMVDVGGYRLHLYCRGEGGPTVVMDAGAGEFGLSWDAIQSEIARHTRACVYDRAGLGWSDPSPQPRTNEVMVEELRTLFSRAGLPAPYVLVGASLGGLNARLYAHQYPQEVAGLVLVDAAHEDQYTSEGMRQAFESILKMMPRMYAMLRLVVKSGLPALLPGRFSAMLPVDPRLPEKMKRAMFALRVVDTRYFTAAEAELAAIPDSHARLRDLGITSLGDLPMIVLQHGKIEPMQTPEMTEMNEERNRRQQALVAAQSTNGRLVVAEQSGHAIQIEQPEIVVESILEVLDKARQRISAGRDRVA